VTEINSKEQITKLVQLQKIDSKIYEIKQQLSEKPKEVERLKNLFESKKIKLSELEEKSKSILLKRKEFELQLKEKEEDIAKGNTQLNQLKTNKEYSAKLSEIESVKADKSLIEEKILELFEDMDRVNSEINDEKVNVGEEEKKYLAKKKEVEDEVKVLESNVKGFDSQKETIIPETEASFLSIYEKILKNKEGLAIVPVVGSACGGCYMNLTPQTINEVRMNEEMIKCEVCYRILYIEEDDA